MRVSEGKPYPLGATADETGANFAVFSAQATRVEVCVFDAPQGREIERFELPEYTDEVFHGHVDGRRARDLLRLPRPWPLRARGRPPVQSEQAPARPLRARPRRQARLGPRRLRLHDRRRGRRPHLRRARQRALRAEVGDRRSQLRLARRIPPPQRPVGPHDRLRDPRQGLHQAASAGRREAQGFLRGPRLEAHGRLHQVARGDDGRAPARPHLRRRQPPARQGPEELLGLQLDRLLRPRSALRRRRAELACASSRR